MLRMLLATTLSVSSLLYSSELWAQQPSAAAPSAPVSSQVAMPAPMPTPVRCGAGTVQTQSGECVVLAECPPGQVRLAGGACAAVQTSLPLSAAPSAAPVALSPPPPPAELAERGPDPSRGGGRVVLEAGLGIYSGLFIDYDDVDASGGGLPGVSIGLLLRHFAAEVAAVNVDIEGDFSLLFVHPLPNEDDGTWIAAIAGLNLALTPYSTPVSIAIGPWLGLVNYDIGAAELVDGLERAADGTNLAVGGTLAARLLFGNRRLLSLGAAARLGVMPERGGYSDLRILFGYGF